MRAALAADDLATAKNAAAIVAAMPVIHHENGVDAPPGFVQDAWKFAATKSLAEFREVFKSFSQRAVRVTAGKLGSSASHPWDGAISFAQRNGCSGIRLISLLLAS